MNAGKLLAKKSKKIRPSDDISSDEYEEKRVIYLFNSIRQASCAKPLKPARSKSSLRRSQKKVWISTDLSPAVRATQGVMM